MPSDWEPDDLDQAEADGAVAPDATPAPKPKTEDEPLTRGQAKQLFQEAEKAAHQRMSKEADLSRRQDNINKVVDESLRSGSTEWFDGQPEDVRVAARNVACNRMAARDDVSKLSDAEFNAELAKSAKQVAREMSGTTAPPQGTETELETRLDAARNAGESGANANTPKRETRTEQNIDEPRYGASESYTWPTSDDVERELKADLRAANH